MTFQELEEKLGKQDPSQWHQHSNGGGWVKNSATVESSARVFGNALVSGNALVFGDAQVSGSARVTGNARVFGNAWVSGGLWTKPVLFLVDSRGHGATNCCPGMLKIGCEEHTFAEWQRDFPEISAKHKLNADELNEYQAIIDLFCKIGK